MRGLALTFTNLAESKTLQIGYRMREMRSFPFRRGLLPRLWQPRVKNPTRNHGGLGTLASHFASLELPVVSFACSMSLSTRNKTHMWGHPSRLMQPAFHHNQLAAYADIMVKRAQRLADTFQEGEVRQIGAGMSMLTLELWSGRCLAAM